MIWFALALLAWIGTGIVLVRRHGRPSGGDFRRSIAEQIVTVGDTATVTLTLAPPPSVQVHTVEPHDVVLG